MNSEASACDKIVRAVKRIRPRIFPSEAKEGVRSERQLIDDEDESRRETDPDFMGFMNEMEVILDGIHCPEFPDENMNETCKAILS